VHPGWSDERLRLSWSSSGLVAGVAQSAERLTRNEQVRGSIPLPGSIKPVTSTLSVMICSSARTFPSLFSQRSLGTKGGCLSKASIDLVDEDRSVQLGEDGAGFVQACDRFIGSGHYS
jgi:hypothetical protein